MTVPAGSPVDVVDFWRAVEYFEPNTIPPPTYQGRRPKAPVVDQRPDSPFPWQAEHRAQHGSAPAPGSQWRHTVYCGVFDVADVQHLLEEKFGIDDEDADDYRPGQSALAAFHVDAEGRALLETDGVSSSAWAAGRTMADGYLSSTWLTGFEEAVDRFRGVFEWLVTEPEFHASETIEELLARTDDALVELDAAEVWELLEGTLDEIRQAAGATPQATGAVPEARVRRQLGSKEIEALLRLAIRLTEAGELIGDPVIRIESRQITNHVAEQEEHRQDLILQARGAERGECAPPKEKPEPVESAFLNSFIVGDLGRVAQAVRRGDAGPALLDYLTPEEDVDIAARTDVRADSDFVLRQVAPRKMPLGRWPDSDQRPLALSQQAAVNSIIEQLGDQAGVFAVNGPPGTGKTTLLRELIAHVVVQRALALTRLADPSDAFTSHTGWKTEEGETRIHWLRPELAGHEIVVASANNGAVNNVTSEIPLLDAIDDQWRDKVDYFAEIGSRLLDKPAWGTAAATLGSMRKRKRFAQYFWRGGWGSRENGRYVPPPGGMFEVLRELKAVKRQKSARISRWRKAVESFRATVQRAHSERESRARLKETERRLHDAQQRVADGPASIEAARQRMEVASARTDMVRDTVLDAQQTADIADAELAEHRTREPGFLRQVRSLGRERREWTARCETLIDTLNKAENTFAQARSELDAAYAELYRREAELAALHEELERQNREKAELEEEYHDVLRALGDHLPSESFGPQEDSADRELSAPWNDPTMAHARTEVFLAALALHREFLHLVPAQMSKNLEAVVGLLKGNAPVGAPRQALLAAWQSLFFVVPVISTTFASFSRLFEHIRREELGWVLIDEAGQATPQQAVGALWRAKRAVAVGDPLQLEPICTLPFTAQQALRNHHKVSEKWLPAWSSVQTLTDAVTPFGTELSDTNGDPIWVGSPLRVHRRCLDPMFTVSNQVAYDGMMVYGTSRVDDSPLYPSLWIHVSNPDGYSEGHWVPREGQALERVLKNLQDQGQDMEQVFVISPFRVVAHRARTTAQSYGVNRDNAGTIHTTQGKEADVVILMLGGDPRRPGAKKWAAKRPNLINVAVSRAKQRLYVIGDHPGWAEQEHFEVLAGHMKVWTIPM
ncbi:hypothetical protein J4H86_23965 [Spiractinospora alimapuensis]|uniref:AAA domain-containing protein n=1 Tax=Spiractinospora alimapuensis TaxID=2820884 RepID=UPI001F467056|nr:AAA domain-containing protein [Spiractinospora alimapuensis]QVQ51786.1 hypothetical protein J4H86_23965 [Spiractinospora alimapuensis]